MTLQPLGDFVMVKQKTEEPETKLVLTEDSRESYKRAKGEVVAIGTGEEVVAFGLAVGETVYFIEHAGEPLKQGEDDFLLLRPHELLAVER